MAKSKQLLILFTFLSIQLFAQPNVNIEDPAEVYTIGKNVLFYADSTNNLSFEEIKSQKYSRKFFSINQEAANFETTPATIWGKFTITNKTDLPLYLEVPYYSISELDFYCPIDSNHYIKSESGQYRNFEKRDLNYNNYNFDLKIKKGETKTYYARFKSWYILIIPLKVYSISQLVKYNHNKDLLHGIYLGLVLVMLFYNLFIYVSTRDISYLYYVIYSVTIVLLNGHLAGLNFEFLHPHYPLWNNYGLAYPGYAGLMALLFSWQFLSIRKNAPQMQKFQIGIAIAYVIGIGCVYLNLETYSSIIIRIGGLMIPIVLIASAIIVYKKGYKPALYYLLAWGSFLISIIIYLLITFDAVPQNEFTGSAMEIGSAIEIILLSIALGDKINFYKDENEKAQLHALNIQRKANEELEMKVKERTEEIVKINEEVMAQRDDIERQKDLLEIEKNKSDKLLLNILPFETAKELKDNGFTNPRYYEQVTVMFTDFKQFTNIAEELTPQQIIFELDKCFLAFDDICEKYNLERIKTIGDAYMAGGGIPIVNKTNAVDTVRAALEIQQFLTEFNKEKVENGSRAWQVRIGIHTGAVVAGVVGKKKFAYDIWGDAVNVASRMESCGEIGKVNISGQTYELIKDQFNCTYRGKVFAKNKGEVDMYFVESQP